MLPRTDTAKIFGFINEGASAWRVLLLGLLLGLTVTAALVVTSSLLSRQQVQQRFELLASERTARIEERLMDQTGRLDSLRRFATWAEPLTERAFEGFSQPLLTRTRGYSWMPVVSAQDRARFEAQAGFPIQVLGPSGELVDSLPAQTYFPIYFNTLAGGGRAPYGFDVGSSPERRSTLNNALASQGLAASAPLDLIGLDSPYNRGVLVVAPVYHWRTPSSGQAAPRLRGFVSAIVSVHELLANGLPDPQEDNLCVRILDLSNPGQQEVLYASDNQSGDTGLAMSRLLHLADRSYRIELSPSQVFMSNNRSAIALSIGVLGTLLTLLLCVLLYSLVTQRQRALRLVSQRTDELSRSEQQLRHTHAQLKSILDAATEVAIIGTDLSGMITTFNAGAERMFGYSETQVTQQMRLGDFHLHSELANRAGELEYRLGRPISTMDAMLYNDEPSGSPEAHHWTLVRSDGSSLTANMLVTAMHDEHAELIGYLAVCIDVTESLRTLQALAARDRLLERLSAEVPGGIFQLRFDNDGSSAFVYASRGLEAIYEIDLATLAQDASGVFERVHPDDEADLRASIVVSARQLTRWQAEYRVCLPLRGERWVRGEATPERLAGGSVLWHGYLSDISDLKRVEHELRRLSVTDALTGIHNRRYFQERLEAELDRARRERSSLAIVMLDIDHFKRINDRFGHPVGDRVLQAICRTFSQRLRRNDVFCRLGGEEFAVLCAGSNLEQAHCLAMELWQAVRGTPVEGVGQVTASFGVAGWRTGESGEALLARADAGVYLAKQSGRDQVVQG
ncbi:MULTISPECIES: GGDEF domain-containing protein [Pseudomonas]|uniref:diguanylate cyclase n=1 Tax=Pseudomonas quercus TaxID=2722792 RepID=A0ABX0YF16_9PSED|nr:MULTISPECIES: GGDEF domain-containing protein [Pseudomonas]MBF7143322.1 diguanylate cyclase [Pseudomonas sp. LY10J]NJP01626.1 diguanylate cyclase [Pseudomonas quercus]